YGPGYTGDSGGWLDEQISLDAYAGRSILLRFEMITDEAKNQPGVTLDDVRIPEIGYATDFENEDDGWIAEGWVRTDNRLPQRTWVQAVQYTDAAVTINRWLVEAGERLIETLPLDPAVKQVVLVVSPFAPVTTVATAYQLHVSTP
ncbi:MAG: immune inhibitor A, partial [Anaerolineae bacterium]|nr:immune inhibitor A [Anaerolineae bacterium]